MMGPVAILIAMQDNISPARPINPFIAARCVALALLILLPCRVLAQTSASAAPGVSDATRWGFFFNLGIGDQSGDFAGQLQKGTTGEFGLLKQEGDWRYGLSLSFGSWGMAAPFDHELEWGFQRIDILAGKVFKPE